MPWEKEGASEQFEGYAHRRLLKSAVGPGFWRALYQGTSLLAPQMQQVSSGRIGGLMAGGPSKGPV